MALGDGLSTLIDGILMRVLSSIAVFVGLCRVYGVWQELAENIGVYPIQILGSSCLSQSEDLKIPKSGHLQHNPIKST